MQVIIFKEQLKIWFRVKDEKFQQKRMIRVNFLEIRVDEFNTIYLPKQ